MLSPDPSVARTMGHTGQPGLGHIPVSTVAGWGSLLIQTKTHSTDGMIPPRESGGEMDAIPRR